MKSFIFGEFQTDYLRTSFSKIPGNQIQLPRREYLILFTGKSPEVIFYNVDNVELERIPIDKMTREELNQLMVEKGIEKKPKEEKEEDGSDHDEM